MDARESWAGRLSREIASALRSLIQQPRYSIPAILSVALGIGASLSVFAVFSALMLRPLPFADEARLVRVGFPGAGQFAGPDDLVLSHPITERLRGYADVFESLASLRMYAVRLERPGEPARWVPAQWVDGEYFDTLGVSAIRGRVFSARDSGGVVMRDYCWRTELGTPPPLGSTLMLDGTPMPFIGIIADEQALPGYGCMWLVPTPDGHSPPQAFYYQGYARLARGLTLDMAQQRLRGLTSDLDVKGPAGGRLEVALLPLRDTLVDAERSWLSLMLAAVFMFLLMACANLASLLATRAAVRQHERAVRAALGATRWALAREALSEAFVLVGIGALAGLGLAQLGIAYANERYIVVLANLPARIDLRVLAALTLLVLVCTLAGSLAPVLVLRQVAPVDALRAEGRASASRGAGRIRRIMVVIQVTAMVALSIDAGLLVRSMLGLLGRETGFSTQGIVAAKAVLDAPPHDDIPERFMAQRAEVQRQARALVERVRTLEGVRSVAIGRVPFDYASERTRMQLEPGARSAEAGVRIQCVTGEFFDTLGIQLLSGKGFGPEHDGWPPQRFAIVSRNFAEQALGVPDAVGHRLRFAAPPGVPAPPWIEIIGMVEDTAEEPLTDPAPMTVYFPFLAYPNRAVNSGNVLLRFVLATTRPEYVMSRLPAAIAEVLPRAPVTEVRRLEDLVRDTIDRRLALSQVLSLLALVALVLAAIGLAGVASYSVTQRWRELSIRRVLGASERRIRLMVLADTALLVGAGLGLGGIGAWLSRRLLVAFMYGIAPLDALTYLGVAAGAACITVLASWIATRPIVRASPARALARG